MKLEFPGGWYCDALPSGEYAVLVKDSHVQTHQGRINLPAQGEAPLYLRITNIGGFQIAGQGFGPVTWWWTADHGWVRKPAAVGVSPVIFDNLGNLHISDGSVGSQGWRYVAPDGRLVTGDETYNSPRWGLAEWSDIGGWFVGQSIDDKDNALVLGGIKHRLLEPGPCRFIRATRSGNNVAIAIWKPRFGAVLYWLTLDELLALPLVNESATQPKPQPKPEPKPEPQPVPLNIPNYRPIVDRVRAQFPKGPLGALRGQFLIELVRAINAANPPAKPGLHLKRSGVKLWNGVSVDGDLIVFPDGHLFDVLSQEEKLAEAMWHDEQIHVNSIKEYYDVLAANPPAYEPSQPAPQPEPKPEPTPQPPVPSDDDASKLDELRHDIDVLIARNERLEARVAALEKPRTVEIDSSRVWGHSHKVTVTFP